MKKILILTFLFCSKLVIAQTFRAGLAADFTSGSYGGTNITRSDNLFAKTGSSFFVSFSYPIKKNFSLLLETGQCNHPFDNVAYEKAYTNATGKQTEAIQASDYKNSYTLIGAGFQTSKGKLNYGGEIAAGLMNMTTPSYLLNYTFTGNTGTESITSQRISSYAFAWALHLEYAFHQHWLVGLRLKNLTSTFESATVNYTSSNQVTKTCKLEVYQTALYVGYKL